MYVSLLFCIPEHLTPAGTPTPRIYPEALPEEDCIPSLNDILAASFANVSILLPKV